MKYFVVLLCLAWACQVKSMTRVLLTDAAASKVRRQLHTVAINYAELCPVGCDVPGRLALRLLH